MDEHERSVLTPEQEDMVHRIVAEEIKKLEKRITNVVIYDLSQRMKQLNGKKGVSTMSTELQTKGRGYIRVSKSLWDEIGTPETPEAWHKVLLLPETYEIERIEHHDYWDSRGNVFDLFVQHEDIPIVGDHTPMPEVQPHYRAEFHEDEKGLEKKALLDHIEIWAWQDGQWKQVK